jgi:hypothetical protein
MYSFLMQLYLCDTAHFYQFGFYNVWNFQGSDYEDTVVWYMLLCNLIDIIPFALLLKSGPS